MTERNDRPESTEAGTKKASASKTARKKTAATKSSTPKAGTRKASAGQSTARKAKGEKAAVQPVPASRNAFEAGAARASGERRRRSGTPLLSALEPVELSAARREVMLAKLALPEQPGCQPADLAPHDVHERSSEALLLAPEHLGRRYRSPSRRWR